MITGYEVVPTYGTGGLLGDIRAYFMLHNISVGWTASYSSGLARGRCTITALAIPCKTHVKPMPHPHYTHGIPVPSI